MDIKDVKPGMEVEFDCPVAKLDVRVPQNALEDITGAKNHCRFYGGFCHARIIQQREGACGVVNSKRMADLLGDPEKEIPVVYFENSNGFCIPSRLNPRRKTVQLTFWALEGGRK